MNSSHLSTQKKLQPDIDALLQNSYLLVTALCQDVPVEQGDTVWQLCIREIKRVRQELRDAGISESAIEHISYAQCALLDETILKRAKDAGYTAWRAASLQAYFFDTAEAGNQLYERIRTVLHEPAPNKAVLTCFHRVLMLGFEGHGREDTPLVREQLITRLNEQVVPFGTTQSSPLLDCVSPSGDWQYAVARRLVVTVVVLAGVWWGLSQYLATLFPGLTR
ncbi:type VI secretion protein ImpK [Photorhabdus heterorhabditis]|uniref:Type VI secretion protein ImpK n=1 Tax=Photorhabdus heterorhabditis TaxID=880156 RepID=A0ABR5K6Q1_9GAMM|nr:type VI secretion system protein TssL, short form [Photorhabdus heterorhabditis]KOY60213.1 type VI secretion protein ImpK [Photorhabdus heterorhabditis]